MSLANRRDFAQQLLIAAVGSQLIDVEKLLWVPKTMITVPETYVLGVLRRDITYVRMNFEVTTFGDSYRRFM